MVLTQITLQLISADSDAADLDRYTRRLRDELRELDVESVDLVQGNTAPAGTKSGAEFMLGELAIKMLADQLPKLLPVVAERALSHFNGKVKLKVQKDDRVVEIECGKNDLEKVRKAALSLIDKM